MKNEEGDFFQVIPISPRFGRVLESSKRKFKRIFGREPRDSDPVLIEQYLVSVRDVKRETMDAMIAAGIRSEILYAYRKTGRLLTRKNARLLPDSDVAEWDAAINEYRKIKTSRLREPAAIVELRAFIGELDSCIILLGYFLERGTKPLRSDSVDNAGILSVPEYALFCIARCFSALQSIDWMLDKDRGVDAMPLIRAIYECYLHMRFLERHPEKLRGIVDAQVGLQQGTHSFAKNAKGAPDRRIIIDNSTGEKFDGHISLYRMAQSSHTPSDPFLFPYLYEHLSGFVHPSVEYLSDYASHENSLDAIHDDRIFEACCYAITVACMVLDYAKTSELPTPHMIEDLERVLGRISKRAIKLLGREVKAHSSELDKQLLQRWKDIATTNG